MPSDSGERWFARGIKLDLAHSPAVSVGAGLIAMSLTQIRMRLSSCGAGVLQMAASAVRAENGHVRGVQLVFRRAKGRGSKTPPAAGFGDLARCLLLTREAS